MAVTRAESDVVGVFVNVAVIIRVKVGGEEKPRSPRALCNWFNNSSASS
jgi:hypothetical protein